nr:unnamed protein product [Spirometra erinaceieuropaei]
MVELDLTTSHLLGRFGLGSRYENGERLLSFAHRNRLLVTNKRFQHRKKHLLTWYSNDGRTASQIDYILVSSRFRSWVHDIRSMRGVETGNAHGSDHVLVRTRLKVHISSAPKMPRPRRLNVAKSRQASTAEALNREIRTCFTARADGEVSNQCSSLKTSVYGAAEKILVYTQRRRSDWISGRTLQLSAETARARSRNDDYFRQLGKMTVKSARDDRKQYWVEIATSMEQASNVGDTRKLYRLILQVSAIDWIIGRALRDSDGVEFAPGHRLTDLDYADDIALLALSFGDLQSMVSRVNKVAKSVGLSINAGKTKVFSSCIPDQEKAPLGIDGCQLEVVDSFKYLGARLLPNGQSKDDIVTRFDAARWVFSSLRKCLWNGRDLSIATKARVYRASLRSVLL